MIETLDELRASAEFEVFRAAKEDESVIGCIVAAQRGELELEIGSLETEAESVAEEARELVGEVPPAAVLRKTRSETLRARPAARRHSHGAAG